MKYPTVRLIHFENIEDEIVEWYFPKEEMRMYFVFIALLPKLKDWTMVNDVAAMLSISKPEARSLTASLVSAKSIITKTSKTTTITKGPLILRKLATKHPTNPYCTAPLVVKVRAKINLPKVLKELIPPPFYEKYVRNSKR